MNLVSQRMVKPGLQAQQSVVSFQGKINPETVGKVADAAKDVFTKATKNPNAEAVKSGVKTIMAVLEKFITKNSIKIKEFIDKGAKGGNKFVRFLAVTAGLIMSILSVVGATTIFKDEVKEPAAEKPPEDVKEPESEKKAVGEATEVPPEE